MNYDEFIASKIALIKKHVGETVGATPQEIDGESHDARIVRGRHLSMLFCRRLLGLSYPALAMAFNKPNHVTALYGCRVIETRIAADRLLALLSNRLESELRTKLNLPRR